ncbi:SIR2 family protein, partial [Candidatus Poribacteria bacterium]
MARVPYMCHKLSLNNKKGTKQSQKGLKEDQLSKQFGTNPIKEENAMGPEEILDTIAAKAKNGQLTVFTGAGISYNSGLPLAKELIDSALDWLFSADKRVSDDSVNQYFDLQKDYEPYFKIISQKGPANARSALDDEEFISKINLQTSSISAGIRNALKLGTYLDSPDSWGDPELLKESKIPFELFISAFREHSDLHSLLKVFKRGKPNTNHYFLAKLIERGLVDTVVTTNFDTLIERALADEGLSAEGYYKLLYQEDHFSSYKDKSIPGAEVNLVKIHGTIDSLDSIRTTLDHVSSGILSNLRRSILEKILHGSERFVLFLGYSFSDVFDIVPALRSFRGLRPFIFVVNHSSSVKLENTDIKELPALFSDYSGVSIDCDTDDFVKQVWSKLAPYLGDYKEIKYKPAWEDEVENWGRQLSYSDGCDSYFI